MKRSKFIRKILAIVGMMSIAPLVKASQEKSLTLNFKTEPLPENAPIFPKLEQVFSTGLDPGSGDEFYRCCTKSYIPVKGNKNCYLFCEDNDVYFDFWKEKESLGISFSEWEQLNIDQFKDKAIVLIETFPEDILTQQITTSLFRGFEFYHKA